jgi:hypothetical protein
MTPQHVLWITSFCVMQCIASLLFKWGSTSDSLWWWWFFDGPFSTELTLGLVDNVERNYEKPN